MTQEEVGHVSSLVKSGCRAWQVVVVVVVVVVVLKLDLSNVCDL